MLPEMIIETLKDAENRMRGAIQSLESDLATFRTGRASPSLLDRLVVEMYGAELSLKEIALVSVPEPQQLAIRPFDQAALGPIEKAIMKSDLGLMPNNDGKIVRLNIPRLTEERRRDLSRLVGRRVEEGKVAIRNVRRDALDFLRDLHRDKECTEDEFHNAEKTLDDLTRKYIGDVDTIGNDKAAEIMEV